MPIQPRTSRRTGISRPVPKPGPKIVTAGEYLGILRKFRLKWSRNNDPYLVVSFQLVDRMDRWATTCVWGSLIGEMYQSDRLEQLGFPRGEILLHEFKGITEQGYFSPVSDSEVDQAVFAFLAIQPNATNPRWLQVEEMNRWHFSQDDHDEVKLLLRNFVLHDMAYRDY